ncbi:hypothetical protein ACFLRM_07190, partial [Acidobacteriota bacterium]
LEGKIHIMLSMLHAMLQHYCETNEMLSFSGLQKKMILSKHRLSVLDKILLGLNHLAVSSIKDKDRGRFMKKIYETAEKRSNK